MAEQQNLTEAERERLYREWLAQGPEIQRQRQKEAIVNPLLDGVSNLSKLLGRDND